MRKGLEDAIPSEVKEVLLGKLLGLGVPPPNPKTGRKRKHFSEYPSDEMFYYSDKVLVHKGGAVNPVVSPRADSLSQLVRLLTPYDPTEMKCLPCPRPGTARIILYNEKLNEEQRGCIDDLISGAHGKAPYIIWGPPGTGQ